VLALNKIASEKQELGDRASENLVQVQWVLSLIPSCLQPP